MLVRPAEPELSVVIPLRNRAGIRLDNCLRSLRWQEIDPARVEIVLSDFGSDPEHAAAIAALGALHQAQVVRCDTEAIWNRSHALNVGIRASRGRYVLATDADMLFAPSFVPTAIERLRRPGGPWLVLCRCRDLPSDVPEQTWTRADYPELEARASFRQSGSTAPKRAHTTGTGACHATTRRWLEHVRGYDERYLFWGCEDGDLVSRAQRSGLRLTWIHDETSMLHQWHPSDRRKRRGLYYRNKLRFVLTRRQVVKNRDGWGVPGP